jgi:hypothetical protein
MKARILTILLGIVFALGLVAAPAAAVAGPNQGDPDKVLTVNNKKVWCKYPKPGPKIEGGLGRTITFSASKPIDKVTVKSGEGAYVVSKWFDMKKGKITLNKDVSNYVVWTCPKY